jgi:hypothetical protein
MKRGKRENTYVDLEREVVRDSRGRRVTDEYAERAAADALAQVGRGRRSLTGKAKPSPRLSLRVTEELAAELDRRAALAGVTRSEFARRELERALRSA